MELHSKHSSILLTSRKWGHKKGHPDQEAVRNPEIPISFGQREYSEQNYVPSRNEDANRRLPWKENHIPLPESVLKGTLQSPLHSALSTGQFTVCVKKICSGGK
jgi:hypothetical protein